MRRPGFLLVSGLALVLLGATWFATRAARQPTLAGLAPAAPGHDTDGTVGTLEVEPGETLLEVSCTVEDHTSARAAVAPPPDTLWSFSGRARRGTYGVLADAPVRVSLYAGVGLEDGADFGVPLAEVTLRTDAAGRFEGAFAPPLAPATLVAVAVLEQHKVGRDVRTVVPGAPSLTDLEPWAYSLDARVRGRVTDEHGAGVAGALVASHLSEVRSDSVGTYDLPLDSTYPSLTVRVIAAGYAVAKISLGAVEVGENTGPTIVLQTERFVVGSVVDAQGVALAGATVTGVHFALQKTTTDSMGQFRLGGFRADDVRVRVSAALAGYVSASAPVLREALHDASALVEADPSAVRLVLLRGATVTGRVVDEAGLPIQGALVTDSGWPNVSGARIQVTAEDGSFELARVRAGRVSFWARHPGHAAASVDLQISDKVEREEGAVIRLAPGQRISGHVVDERDVPVFNAEVRPEAPSTPFAPSNGYGGDSVRTGPDGAFTLIDLPGTRATVSVFAEGLVSETATIADGARIVLHSTRTGRIIGRIVDGDSGAPVDPFVVRLAPVARTARVAGGVPLLRYGVAWLSPGVTFAGTGGVFDTSREPLTAGAVTDLVVSAPGYAPTFVPRVVVSTTPTPDALVIELFRGAVIEGFVTDGATGRGIPEARVEWSHATAQLDGNPYQRDATRAARTDASGRFELTSVPYGPIVLVVAETRLPTFTEGPFELERGTRSLRRDIVIDSGSAIAGRVLDTSGRPIDGADVQLHGPLLEGIERIERHVRTDRSGAYAFEHLAPGPYMLTGKAPEASPDAGTSRMRIVDLAPGQDLEFVLAPSGHATVVGTVAVGSEAPERLTVSLTPRGGAPSEYARHVVRVPVRDGRFFAHGLDAGEWRASVFAQGPLGLFVGDSTVQVPASGEVSTAISVRFVKQ